MMGTMGLSVVAMVYLAEMAPADKRGKLQLRSVGLAMTAVPLSGFFARWIVTFGPEGWRWQYYLGGVFALVVVILVYLRCPESPRWLVSKGRGDEAKTVLQKMLPGVTIDPAAVAAAATERRKTERLGTLKAMKTMWNSFYRVRTILLVLMGIAVSNTASTIQLMMPTLFKARGLSMGNAILIVSLMAWGAPVGVSLASLFLDKGARKIPLAVNGIATAVLLTILGFISGFLPMAFVGLLANLCNPIYYFSCQVYTTESYATNLRSTATGVVMGASRLATAVWMIYIAAMYNAWGFSGFLAFTGACLFVVQIGLLLFGHQTSRRSLEAISGER
jgi:putative MFS transporter